MKNIIATEKAPKAVGPYSQAVGVGGTLYVSGQIPVVPEDGSVPSSIEEQTRQSLKNVGAILAAAGMTYLRGGDDRQIAWTIRNMTGSITGMICDGGKVGCALKLATASAAAVLSSLMAENNAVLRVSDGVCAETAEDCVKNLGRIANPGMTHTDKVVLQIMLDKQK